MAPCVVAQQQQQQQRERLHQREQHAPHTLRFLVNGQPITVDDPDPSLCLGDFLRNHLQLKGLQMPCRQGGCGACTVIVSSSTHERKLHSHQDHAVESNNQLCDHHLEHDCHRNHKKQGNHQENGSENRAARMALTPSVRPINSCLRPLWMMDGLSVTTIEGVGTLKRGLSPIQNALVQHNGTQCGFCTPGFVMSMYSLVQNFPNPTAQQVEDQLDGNLCRCTGYRPILNAFQTFACKQGDHKDARMMCQIFKEDMEDFGCFTKSSKKQTHCFLKDGVSWFRVHSLPDLFSLVKRNAYDGKVKLVVGNTSTGVYPSVPYDICIDISRIPALLKCEVNRVGITIGGALPIADLMNVLKLNRELSPSFSPLLRHLKRVATPQVRAVGSVAGNLMMAHDHKDFISDVATILMAAEAKLRVSFAFSDGVDQLIGLEDFFSIQPTVMVLLEIHLPALPPGVSFSTHKVALRNVNSHAIVNAAFNFEVDSCSGTFSRRPLIVYGGVRSYPQRARMTESFLEGKCFKNSQVFDAALILLLEELTPDISFGSIEYRTYLIASFFYKAFLSLWPKDEIPTRLLSASIQYKRPLSSGKISFGKGDPSEYPVSLPIPKLSSASQVTGDAQYLDDLSVGGFLYAAFVLSSVASATVKSINETKALAMKGVVAFISADTLVADGYCNIVSEYEFLFASERVEYCGQALGVIVANSQEIATAAAKLVEVNYEDIQVPILTIEDAIQANSFFDDRGTTYENGAVDYVWSYPGMVTVEGEVSIGHQYHFHLETQRALCIPTENGCMKVYSSTQNPAQVQRCVGMALRCQQHKITVEVKRVGGAYGSKLNRSASIAMACAIAADKVGRPVKLVLDLSTNMQLVGARSPYFCKYKIGGLANGYITGVEMLIINNQGAHFDFEYPDMSNLVVFIDNTYNIPNWKLYGKVAKTNLPACTYMRGPVFVEATFMIETAIEHLASQLDLQPETVRQINMYSDGDYTLAGQHLVSCNARTIFESVKVTSEYEKRLHQIESFNSENQWIKRGISSVPIKFPAAWEGSQMLCLVNIYPDGSISIHHSGCEIGQGLDVKVAQVAAMTLGSITGSAIQLDDIFVHTTTTIIANNGAESGGSVTSELCAKSVQVACQELVERLSPVSKMMSVKNGKPDWLDLISAALDVGVDLQARGRIYPDAGPNGPFQYLSFGAAVTEVEVDLLTGETRILRADLLLDCGKSLNPAVDIGQMQGAFVQGLGYHLSEDYEYDATSGKLLTDGTWTYKPPSSKDIPIVFNAALLPNSTNPTGFLRSKFSGEPPYGMSCSALFAIRKAIASARIEQGIDKWCPLSSPATVENVRLAAGLPLSLLNFAGMPGARHHSKA